MKVEPVLYGDRKVYTVSAFNRGVSRFLGRLPAVWVEGEVTELRRNEAWANVFLTLKDPKTGATLKVTIARGTFDRLELALEEGETVHVGRARRSCTSCKGELGLRATTIERLGVGGHLVALEQLKRKLAAEGLFAPERKRRLPRVPRAVGILTGADAAARGDLVTTIGRRFPAAKVVVCETRVQGRGAPEAIVAGAPQALGAHPEVDVVVLARGGGSFEDLLPFSAEAGRARGRGLPGAGRLGGRARAGHAALRPRRRRARRDTDRRGRARRPGRAGAPRRARGDAPAARPRGPVARSSATRRGSRGSATASTARRGSSSSAAAPRSTTRARGSRRSPRSRRSRRGYAIVRAGGEALREAAAVSAGETRSRSSSPRAGSARASRTCAP